MKKTSIMGQWKHFLFMAAILLTGLTFAACSDDDGEDIDVAKRISGVYSGKLMTGSTTLDDAYVVTISKISNTVVSLRADFLPGNAQNFNVTSIGGQYILDTSTLSNISISVTGKKLIISYTNIYGNLVVFNGQRD